LVREAGEAVLSYLEQVDATTKPSKPPRWKQEPDLLAWLNSL